MKGTDSLRIAMISYHTSPLAQPGVGDGGGMNVYVRQLATALARLGICCDVYTRADGQNVPGTVRVEPGFEVHYVLAGPPADVPKESLLHFVRDFTDGVLRHIKEKRGNKVDLVHANYWLSGIAGHTIKHELNVPLFTSFHTLEKAKRIGRVSPDDGYDSTVRVWHEQRVMRCSDAILASCAPEAEWITRLYGLSPAQTRIVPLGVDRAFFAPGDKKMARQALGLPQEGRVVLSVGRIQPLKGFSLGAEALELVSNELDVHYVLVGGPSGYDGVRELERIRRFSAQGGLKERLHLFAPQPHELLSSFYRACDLALVPSRTESFGLVALEASASGRPTVASAVGGLLTLVKHGRTGHLVKDRAPRSFAESVIDVIGESDRGVEMGEEAYLHTRSFTWNQSAKYVLEILEDSLSNELVLCG